MSYILVIMVFWSSGSSVATAEFSTLAACNAAQGKVYQLARGEQVRVEMDCVPKK